MLVGVVLGLAVLSLALRGLLKQEIDARHDRLQKEVEALKSPGGNTELLAQAKARASERGVLEFVFLVIDILVRISFGVAIQLLAASARAWQTSRVARVLSLCALSVYFVWVESSSETRLI